jgi:hypothetical protein
MSARAEQSDSVPTTDRPNLELSTQVKLTESEEAIPEDDLSQMLPLIDGMKTCQGLWKRASDQVKQYKVAVS